MTILELLDQAGDRDSLGRGSGIDVEAAARGRDYFSASLRTRGLAR